MSELEEVIKELPFDLHQEVALRAAANGARWMPDRARIHRQQITVMVIRKRYDKIPVDWWR